MIAKEHGNELLFPLNIQRHLVFLCPVGIIGDKSVYLPLQHLAHVPYLIDSPRYDADIDIAKMINNFLRKKLIVRAVNGWIESQGTQIGVNSFCVLYQRGKPDVRILFMPVFQHAEIKRLDNHSFKRQILIDQIMNKVGKNLGSRVLLVVPGW